MVEAEDPQSKTSHTGEIWVLSRGSVSLSMDKVSPHEPPAFTCISNQVHMCPHTCTHTRVHMYPHETPSLTHMHIHMHHTHENGKIIFISDSIRNHIFSRFHLSRGLRDLPKFSSWPAHHVFILFAQWRDLLTVAQQRGTCSLPAS